LQRGAQDWRSASGAESSSRVTRPRGDRILRYLLICIAWMFVVDGFVGENGLAALIRAGRQYRTLDKSLASARRENDRLRKEVRLLRVDPTTIEEFARRELGLIRPGETMFIIMDAPAPAPAPR
jgi:cell division protein FtsB